LVLTQLEIQAKVNEVLTALVKKIK